MVRVPAREGEREGERGERREGGGKGGGVRGGEYDVRVISGGSGVAVERVSIGGARGRGDRQMCMQVS